MARKHEVLPSTTFTLQKFLLVTVKERLKSVLNYRSYPKNKTGYPFLNHFVYTEITKMTGE